MYALILVVAFGSSINTTKVEFNSHSACVKAQAMLVSDIEQVAPYLPYQSTIISSRCLKLE